MNKEAMEMLFLLISFLLVQFLVLYVCYLSTSNSPGRSTDGASKSYTLIGDLPGFIKNRNRFIDWTTEILLSSPTYTTVLRRPGSTPTIMTANPSNVEHILKTNFVQYPKGEKFTSLLRDVFGDTYCSPLTATAGRPTGGMWLTS